MAIVWRRIVIGGNIFRTNRGSSVGLSMIFLVSILLSVVIIFTHLNGVDDEDVTLKFSKLDRVNPAPPPPAAAQAPTNKWTKTNPHWQELDVEKGTIFLYGAYWDSRIEDKIVVRLLTLVSKVNMTSGIKFYCHLWYKSEEDETFNSISVEVIQLDLLWDDHNDKLDSRPYFISCPINVSKNEAPVPPVAVTLTVDKKIEAWPNVPNFLTVVHNPLQSDDDDGGVKSDVVTCTKGLYYLDLDLSSLLIEWVEIHRILGVKKIVLYEYPGTSHPNFLKVLKYFNETDSRKFVDVVPYSIPQKGKMLDAKGSIAYINSHYHEHGYNDLMNYHDCFYRNMYRFKYVALIDIDEVILPLKGQTWTQLLSELVSLSHDPVDAFSFEDNIFMDPRDNESIQMYGPFPPHPDEANLHMIQNVYRIHQIIGGRKCFFNTETAFILSHHNLQSCLEGRCNRVEVTDDLAHMHHYLWRGAKSVKGMRHYLNQSERAGVDRGVWNYKKLFVPAVEETKKQIFSDSK